MKTLYWIGGIAAAGLLIGTGVRLAAHSGNASPAPLAAATTIPPTAGAPLAGAVPAVTARADAGSTVAGVGAASGGQYQVGDHLKQSASVTDQPYQASGKVVGGYREIAWESLIPKDWDAMAPFKGLKLDQLDDNDPRAAAALWKAKKYWKDAPVDPSMEGAAVRLPGFVVSLDREGEALKEFLLVPYFGACIHVPPPPANQIIHVKSSKAVKNVRTMDAVWISGVVKVERSDSSMGAAGYSMTAVKVEPYTAPDNG
ncbi:MULTISPECIES: DUF3299 domain-containing protein [unclassified Herbaspirillum]|uniref:DUF3299 domain-containing protein n=1 Tax=unclassified Herbaspirillum TaxID=2624150 RepID=UPI0011520744|nr:MULTISPECIES: DUF3299 domain-containing protein [unclassified Herbaspirillum]MBB5392026.1 hypothetical protein [Herbaspirillum sp. SJZ102]TQK13484.1 hypothetical protein FB599_0901 [Herbaspirillum sp. SJZ130]TQK15487.1 hypothetical protein FB598_0838 [Herbaspirillum sp. SJZ106]